MSESLTGEALTDAELSAIERMAFVELSAAKYKSLMLARLLNTDIRRMAHELRATWRTIQLLADRNRDLESALATRTAQCERMRMIIEGEPQVANG
jgi:CRP-like cAMP-binding protein